MTERYGGVTAYQRSPAQGAWKAGGQVTYDQVVIFEVMVSDLDRRQWAAYRADLEEHFQQKNCSFAPCP